MLRLTTLAFALSISAVVACGGSQPPASAPPAAEADAAAPPAGEPAADAGAPARAEGASAHAASSGFHALSHEQQVEIMRTKVVSNVGKLFKEHDAAKYGNFSCKTCHGASSKNEPHDVLPKLTLSNGGFEKLQQTKPAMMKFMSEEVVPTMAAAMGEKPFDPATKQGFGCAGCHKVD
jgi:hypothetical protein